MEDCSRGFRVLIIQLWVLFYALNFGRSLQLLKKNLDEKSVCSKHQQLLHHHMKCPIVQRRQMTSMSLLLRIIIEFQLLKRKFTDKFLKTRKIREAEEAARKPKITKAVIRVRFPDHHTLEVTFHASETIQSLVDLLKKVVTRPELPFYIYTAPPKKQITDMPQDFYNAGFVPGAIVYFSYDLREGDDSTDANSAPFLQEEIMSLKDLDFSTEQSQQAEAVQSAPEPVPVTPAPVVQEQKAAGKKPVKPKWLRM
ncbi:hypothetical protein F2P56_000552 [Juglans regia]|uniref:Plant UBX domain-containing protein 1-like isoform X3 n=2 Tax=Juglans regia TaxID=51240 RepID=A0A2I4HNB7_JUGRE|nr:plant UBX domain-containing protein 1-like isoform X3 [Juglans regia]KAF5479759.1 hypothetical protein F2P56_000552 [Juglans regia]